MRAMTYKLAILDDEELMREGIAMKYPFAEKGYEIVFSDDDAYLLLQKIEQNQIELDLIFVDILMPKLNGLEFIRQLREISSDQIEVVIISGHDQFEYAQKAIGLNVMDYLLKPLDPAELNRVMQKVQASLDRKRKKKYEVIHHEICEWFLSYNRDVELGHDARKYLNDLLRENRNVFLILFGNLQTMSPSYHTIRAFFSSSYDFEISHQGAFHLFVHFDPTEQYAAHLFEQFDFPTVAAVHFTGINKMDDLPRCISYGIGLIQMKLVLGRHVYEKVKWEKDLDSRFIKIDETSLSALKRFEQKGHQENGLDELRRFLEMDLPQHMKENVVQQFAREFLQLEVSLDWLQQFDRPDEFVDECMYLLQKSSDKLRPTTGKDILKSVIKDLEAEYFLNLSIKDYAERYHIHPNHLGSVPSSGVKSISTA